MSSDKLLDSSDGTVVVADWKAINLEGKLARAIHVNQIHLRCAQRDVVTKIFVNQVNDQIQVCRHGTTGDDIAFINNQLLLSEVNTRESSLKFIRKKPMSGCPLSVQESSGTKHEGAGTYTCHVGSAFVALTNPVHIDLISF